MGLNAKFIAVHTFQLRRLSDDLVYTFHRVQGASADRFAREDRQDLFIEYDKQLGWIALDPETGEVAGKPWSDSLRHNKGQPPEGDWVSKKGAKSYVYELRYVA
jgi:hypothetical protein